MCIYSTCVYIQYTVHVYIQYMCLYTVHVCIYSTCVYIQYTVRVYIYIYYILYIQYLYMYICICIIHVCMYCIYSISDSDILRLWLQSHFSFQVFKVCSRTTTRCVWAWTSRGCYASTTCCTSLPGEHTHTRTCVLTRVLTHVLTRVLTLCSDPCSDPCSDSVF